MYALKSIWFFPHIIDQEFKKLVKPLVKHVRLHLIDANDLMKV